MIKANIIQLLTITIIVIIFIIIIINLASKLNIYQATFNESITFQFGIHLRSHIRKHQLIIKKTLTCDKILTKETISKLFENWDCNSWSSTIVDIIAVTNTDWNQTIFYFLDIDHSFTESLG